VVLRDSCKSWKGRTTLAAQFSDKMVQDQRGMGQTEVEIHATAMPHPEGVHTKGFIYKRIEEYPIDTAPESK